MVRGYMCWPLIEVWRQFSISTNEGKAWEYTRHLERDTRGKDITTRSAYPSIIMGRNGTLHVVYSHHHNDREGASNKAIKYVKFNEAWVRQLMSKGRRAHDGARLE